MKRILQNSLVVSIILVSNLSSYGKAQTSSEIAGLIGFIGLANIYTAYRDGELPDSWDDILTMDEFFSDRYDRLVRPIRDGRNLTELYSFVSPEDREKFPEGELFLVRHAPLARQDGSESMGSRSFLYRNEHGRLRGETWDEERFQTMLAETGIEVPPPTPLPPEPLRPAGIQQQVPPRPPAPDTDPSEERTEATDPVRVPDPSAEQPHESPEEAEDRTNRGLIWFIAGVVALLILLLGWRAMKRGSRMT